MRHHDGKHVAEGRQAGGLQLVGRDLFARLRASKQPHPVGPSPKKLVNECYTFPFVKGEQAHQAPFVKKCQQVYKGK